MVHVNYSDWSSSATRFWVAKTGANQVCKVLRSARIYMRRRTFRKSTVFEVFCHGGWIIERGNLLCAGYAPTRGYASNLRLRGPVFVVFCHGGCIHRTRQFLMCWLLVYAWLRVKIKVKGTGLRIVLWCGLDHGTRQFLMCWLRVYAWLRVKIKAKSTGVRSVLLTLT